jgi:hypothetical protein
MTERSARAYLQGFLSRSAFSSATVEMNEEEGYGCENLSLFSEP